MAAAAAAGEDAAALAAAMEGVEQEGQLMPLPAQHGGGGVQPMEVAAAPAVLPSGPPGALGAALPAEDLEVMRAFDAAGLAPAAAAEHQHPPCGSQPGAPAAGGQLPQQAPGLPPLGGLMQRARSVSSPELMLLDRPAPPAQ